MNPISRACIVHAVSWHRSRDSTPCVPVFPSSHVHSHQVIQGSLDLTGRFERRYASLLARFTPFAASLTAVGQQLAVEWADPTPEDLAEEERWTCINPDDPHIRELGARMRRQKITRRSAAWSSFAEQSALGEHGTEYMVDELREALGTRGTQAVFVCVTCLFADRSRDA
jgi:hypothetical protein